MALLAPLYGCGGLGDPPGAGIDAGDGNCTDGIQNGSETDVDCGGDCGVCRVGKGCDDAQDCETGACAAGVCISPASCKMLSDGGVTESGVYQLAGDTGLYDAFCDMETDGGGWTLIMKATSTTTTLSYASTLWSSEELLNETDLVPNTSPTGTEAKFAAFTHVSGSELRLEFLDPPHDITHGPFVEQSPLALFSGPEIAIVETNDCLDEALTVVPSYDGGIMRHASGHQFFGINGTEQAGGNDESLRFGFGSNDEDDNAWQPHNGIGSKDVSLIWTSHDDCGGCDGCYGNPYNPNETSANLWIR